MRLLLSNNKLMLINESWWQTSKEPWGNIGSSKNLPPLSSYPWIIRHFSQAMMATLHKANIELITHKRKHSVYVIMLTKQLIKIWRISWIMECGIQSIDSYGKEHWPSPYIRVPIFLVIVVNDVSPLSLVKRHVLATNNYIFEDFYICLILFM